MDYANCIQHLELSMELSAMLVQLRIAVSKKNSYFRKGFQMLFAVKEREIQTDSKSVARSNIATTKLTKIQNYAKIDR